MARSCGVTTSLNSSGAVGGRYVLDVHVSRRKMNLEQDGVNPPDKPDDAPYKPFVAEVPLVPLLLTRHYPQQITLKQHTYF